MSLQFAPGTTEVSITVQIVDDDGLPVTGLVASTWPSISYRRHGPYASVLLVLSDLGTLTSAWDGTGAVGVHEDEKGYYRLDLPNSLFAAASRWTIKGEATGKRLVCPVIECKYADVDAGDIATALSSSGFIVPAGTTQSVIVNGSKSGGTVGSVNSGSTKTIYVYVQSSSGAAVTPTAIRYRRHDAKTKTQLKDWTTLTPGDPTAMVLAAADNALHNADRNSEQHILTIEATYPDGSIATGEWLLGVERIEFA